MHKVNTGELRGYKWRRSGRSGGRTRFDTGVPIRREGNPLSVRRPCGSKISARMICNVAQFMRRKIENPDVRLPAAARHESKSLPVGRERPLVIKGGIICQPLELRSVPMYPIY